ncbi:MAG: methyltransferase, partial [Candidatus Thiodiazotropha endolucinida]
MLTKEKLDKLRKDIVFTEELSGERLQFHSTWGIFSPREIDEGTRLLVDRLRIAPTEDCLDMGCG